MKNFGKGSLSSVISVILNVMWYLVLIGSIGCALFMTAVIFSPTVQKFITDEIKKGSVATASVPEKDDSEWEKFEKMVEAKKNTDLEDWEMFRKAPIALKMLAYPYMTAVIVLLLNIISKSRRLFENFRSDIVFNSNNVAIIAGVNKLLIAFSIITFNFSGLLTCVLLFMLGEIFKNGAALQEEHDLTV